MAAHRMWQVYDLVLSVMEQLPDNRSRARAARVCRAFYDPALDVLWMDLSSLLPIFKLFACLQKFPMSARLIIWQNYRYQLGVVLPDELVRFNTYAGRVRSIIVEPKHYGDIDFAQIVSRLASYCADSGPLLAHLQKATIKVVHPWDCLALLPLLPEALSYLELRAGSPPDTFVAAGRGQVEETEMMKSLLARVPALNTLQVMGFRHPQTLLIVPAFTHLRYLLVHGSPGLPALAWRSLAALETLEELASDAHEEGCGVSSSGFPSLRSLTLGGKTTCMAQILQSITSPYLQSLQLYTHTPDDDMTIHILLEKVGSRFADSLLSLGVYTGTVPFAHGTVIPISHYMRPLLPLRHLQRFQFQANPINFGVKISLTNADVQEMAMAWLNLTDVFLHFEYSTSISGRAVIDWARLCPCLKTIQLPRVDLSDLPNSEPSAGLGHGLRILSIRSLVADPTDPVRVAIQLYSNFPHITLQLSFGDGRRADMNFPRWMEVQRLLRRLQRG
ncbi:hypothetical protein OBBRIDRAFT_801960 [Obba rivulosa]|uniref:F-box domain-containing protein n=1 Tax=Obba rivulosa TaxID=1052685 RepID=A0A8E2DPF4_9APHY|nr:hypothetical protein OBBRIDRAFT_801960 [Obba rivulosa]